VNAFEYFDEKNRNRLQVVKDLMVSQKNNLSEITTLLKETLAKIEINEKLAS
jgi:hypothetical protein